MKSLLAIALIPVSWPLLADESSVPAAVPDRLLVLHEDRSWTHIGDGNFSPESNGFSDLTTESAGPAVEFTVKLADARRAAIGEDRWRSAALSGSVIGNDTGQFGETTPTIVSLGGREIGRITESGEFRVVFDKARLLERPKEPLVFRVSAGANSAMDLDDQELGGFRLELSTEPPPKPPVPPAADSDKPPVAEDPE